MPMRKEMTATAVASTTIFPLVGFSAAQLLNQTATAPQQSIPVRVRKTVNEVIVPNLKKGWAKQVLPCFRPALTADEVHTLERALNAYVLGRVARTNPIFWDDFHARLEGFARTSRALLDEFDSLGPAYSLAWSKIVELSKRCPERRLDRDSIYPILSALHASSVRALERACERRQAGIKGDHAAAWTELIVKLAELFERAGDRATAPKGRRGGGYANASPFVALVWAIVTEAIPEKLREYNQSHGAMANAISKALSKRRQWRGDPLQFLVE